MQICEEGKFGTSVWSVIYHGIIILRYSKKCLYLTELYILIGKGVSFNNVINYTQLFRNLASGNLNKYVHHKHSLRLQLHWDLLRIFPQHVSDM